MKVPLTVSKGVVLMGADIFVDADHLASVDENIDIYSYYVIFRGHSKGHHAGIPPWHLIQGHVFNHLLPLGQGQEVGEGKQSTQRKTQRESQESGGFQKIRGGEL